MKVIVIYNAKSGSARTIHEWKKLFRQSGHEVSYSFDVTQLRSRKLAILIEEGVTVAAIGGDGTLNTLAQMIAHTSSTLLPLPGGTFNHFVRDTMRSTDIDQLVASIDHMRTKRVDVGYVNDQIFLNNSNIGLYPFSLIERKKTKKLIGKWPAAALSAIDQLVAFKRHRLIIDGVRLKSPFIFIGNNEYEIETAIVPERRTLDKGTLCVMIATSDSRFKFVSAIFDVLRSNIKRRDDFNVRLTKTIRIDSPQKSIPVSFDGEVKKMPFPLEYKIAPKALKILCMPPNK